VHTLLLTSECIARSEADDGAVDIEKDLEAILEEASAAEARASMIAIVTLGLDPYRFK
jgi:hypothetical protein